MNDALRRTGRPRREHVHQRPVAAYRYLLTRIDGHVGQGVAPGCPRRVHRQELPRPATCQDPSGNPEELLPVGHEDFGSCCGGAGPRWCPQRMRGAAGQSTARARQSLRTVVTRSAPLPISVATRSPGRTPCQRKTAANRRHEASASSPVGHRGRCTDSGRPRPARHVLVRVPVPQQPVPCWWSRSPSTARGSGRPASRRPCSSHPIP